MRKRRLIVLLVCCFLLTMAACGGEPSSNGGESIPTKAATKAPEITTAAESAPTPEPTPTPTERPVPVTEIQYVTDGLVALYEADYNTKYGFDAEADYWTDMSGQGNDIEIIDVNEDLHFSDHGLWISSQVVYFPAYITELINTDCYTVELKLSDLEITGADFATLINNHCSGNSGNDHFSLFIRTTNGELEFKNAGNDRPKAANGFDLVNGHTVTITFDLAAGAVHMYSDGVLLSTTVPAGSMDVDEDLFLFVGHNSQTSPVSKTWNGNIQSIRFYDRALTEAEVAQNAAVTEGIVVTG